MAKTNYKNMLDTLEAAINHCNCGFDFEQYNILTSDQPPYYFNTLKKKINEHCCKVILDSLGSETS